MNDEALIERMLCELAPVPAPITFEVWSNGLQSWSPACLTFQEWRDLVWLYQKTDAGTMYWIARDPLGRYVRTSATVDYLEALATAIFDLPDQ